MKRDIAIDYLRSSVIVAVVAHHSALAYTTFSQYNPADYTKSTAPIVDSVRFMPLDFLVSWNDIDDFSTYTEFSWLECLVVTFILHLDEP